MKESYYREYSSILDREMEYAVFGESGKVMFAFGPQNGHTWDFRNFGMVDSVKDWVESGKLMIVCPDGIDEESWSADGQDPRGRIEMQERWFNYITRELAPKFVSSENKGIVTGCSMGGAHAGIMFFRRPDLFDTLISLSGVFDARMFFGDYMDDLVYNNSPVDFLRNIPEDHPYIDLYNSGRIIICCGQGAWEDFMRRDAALMDEILTSKGINHWTDFWGFDVNHDWPWWKKQLPYFLENVIGKPF